MPLVSPGARHPLIDERQSERAMAIRRGVQSLVAALDAVSVPEVTLANGRRADLVSLTKDGAIWIIEIKSSVNDMKTDAKWPDYTDFCDHLYFATLADVPRDCFPESAGFIVADRHGAEIVREAPLHPLSPARRKALTLRFARAAAQRLYRAELDSDGF